MFGVYGSFGVYVDETPVTDGNTPYNLLDLSATMHTGIPTKNMFSSSVGVLFKNRDAKITIEIDNGTTDPNDFNQVIVGLFPLDSDTPLFVKSFNNGISVVDNKLEIIVNGADLTMRGTHYFEVAVNQDTTANLLSGYLTIVDSRITF